MPADGHEGHRRVSAGAVLLCSALLAALCAGCAPLKSFTSRKPLEEQLDEETSIDAIMGPTERKLRAADWERRRESLTSGGVAYEGLTEFDAAQKLFDAGQYHAAERAFHALAKSREEKGKGFLNRLGEMISSKKSDEGTLFGQYGDPIHEDALFMTAECQFAQKRYSYAQDSYGTLLEKYPSSRHLDVVTQRLFYIARYWLGVPEQKSETESEIQLVSHETDGQSDIAIQKVTGAAGWPLLPNILDRTRPVFDTEGRAVQALESIWQHDATGPLADDALMLQATYAQRRKDYIEAARLYQLVREEYPDSPHFEDAFLLGSHVTLASYTGPEYDGKSLEEARNLKEIARTFPDLTQEQRDRLDKELSEMKQAEIEREWALVTFYTRKNQPASVAVHCNRILNRYPDSEYARRAWEILKKQEAEHNGRGRFRLWPFGDDDEEDADSYMPGSGAPPTSAETPPPTPDPESGDAGSQPGGVWRRLGRLFPVERVPQLVEPPSDSESPADTEPPADTENDEPARVRL